nr:hypothetical protein CFP56_62436 [Quercus suber]
MSVPKPPIDLEGHCSAVFDGTLYVLSPAGFQTLPLKADAKWSAGASGQQTVTGPSCVTTGDGSRAAFYVIGGTSDDDSYSGLQRYFFGNQTWETLSPPVGVMKGRTNHGVAYLKDSSSILVYAGSQPDAPSDLSSQTFTIDITSPYNIEAYTSKAPPTNLPIMQAWNSSHALLVGGTQTNTAIYTFSPSDGWQRFKTDLSAPLETSSRAILIDGGDGSKVLNVYNMTASPNTVTGVVLLDSDGKPAATGQVVGRSSSTLSRKRRRDLTVDDWPSYNSTFAPEAIRTDCAVVQADNNVAVIAAGSTDSPVALFDQSDNSWVDADKFFTPEKQQQPLQPSSTTSATPSSTTSASSTPAPGLSPHQRTLRTLGITLGVLFGVAALFILILLFLRWRKMKQKKQEGYIDEKQAGRMSFADRGASFMKEAGGSVNELSAPSARYDTAPGSHSSLAIITGKFGNKRNTNSPQPRASTESMRRLVKDKNGATAMEGEPVEMVNLQGKQLNQSSSNGLIPPPAVYGAHLTEKDAVREERKHRSSGWSKYFATSQPAGPNGLSHLPSAYQKQNVNSMISDGSRYSRETENTEPARIPSASFVPLDIDFEKTIDGHRMSHVTAHNPAFSDSREDLSRAGGVPSLPEGLAGTIEDARRASSQSGRTMSSYNNRSTLSSNITNDYYNESGNTPWTPMSNTFKDHLISRPPSSQYTASVYEPRAPSRGKSAGFFPGAGTSYRPSGKVKMSSSAAPSSEWAAPVMKKTVIVPPSEQKPTQNGITIMKPTRPIETRDSAAIFGGTALQNTQPQQAITTVNSAKPFETRDSTAMFGGPSMSVQPQPQSNTFDDLAPPRAAFVNHSASDSRDSTVTVFPSGLESPKAVKATMQSAQQGEVLAPPPSNVFNPQPTDGRDSTMTLFPRGVSSTYYDDREREEIAQRNQENTKPEAEPQSGKLPTRYSVTQGKQPVVEDMSWLNLELEGGHNKKS